MGVLVLTSDGGMISKLVEISSKSCLMLSILAIAWVVLSVRREEVVVMMGEVVVSIGTLLEGDVATERVGGRSVRFRSSIGDEAWFDENMDDDDEDGGFRETLMRMPSRLEFELFDDKLVRSVEFAMVDECEICGREMEMEVLI